MCGIAPDGTRVTSSAAAQTASSAAEEDAVTSELAAPMSALSMESRDDRSSRSRTDSDCSEDSISDTESKGPITPRTATAEPLDVGKVDETALANATVERSRELMA
jgi:hypothetical protein